MERNRLSILQNIANITRRSRDIIVGRSPEVAASPRPSRTITRPSLEFPPAASYKSSLKRLKVPRNAAVQLNEAYDGKVASIQATVEAEAETIWENLCNSQITDEEVEHRFDCIITIHLKTYAETVDRLYTAAVEIVLAQLKVKKNQKPRWEKKWVPLLVWWFTSPDGQYPDEEQKTWLSDQTGLSFRQITIWFQNRRARTKRRVAQGKSVPQTRKTGSLAPTGHARRPGCCSRCRRPHEAPDRLAAEPLDWDQDSLHHRDGRLSPPQEIIDLTGDEEETVNALDNFEEPEYAYPVPFEDRIWDFDHHFPSPDWQREPMEPEPTHEVNDEEIKILYKEFSHLNVTPPKQDVEVVDLITHYDKLEVEVDSNESTSDSSSDSDEDEWEEVDLHPKQVVTIDNADTTQTPPPPTEVQSLEILRRGVGKTPLFPTRSKQFGARPQPMRPPSSIPRRHAKKLAVYKNIVRDQHKKVSKRHLPVVRELPSINGEEMDNEDTEERDVDTPLAILDDYTLTDQEYSPEGAEYIVDESHGAFYEETQRHGCDSQMGESIISQDTSPEASVSGSSHAESDVETNPDANRKSAGFWSTSGFYFTEDHPGVENVEREDINEMAHRPDMDEILMEPRGVFEPRRTRKKKPKVPLPLPDCFNIPFIPAIAEVALQETIKQWGLNTRNDISKEPEYDHLQGLRQYWTPEYTQDIPSTTASDPITAVAEYYNRSGLEDHFLVLEEANVNYLENGWPRPNYSVGPVILDAVDNTDVPAWNIVETDYYSVVPLDANPALLWNPSAARTDVESDLQGEYGKMAMYLNPEPELWPTEIIPSWKYEEPPVINTEEDFMAYLNTTPIVIEVPPPVDPLLEDPRPLPSIVLATAQPEMTSTELSGQPTGFEFDKSSADFFAMFTGHEFSGSVSTEPVYQPLEKANRPLPQLSLPSDEDADDTEVSAPGFIDWLVGLVSGLPKLSPQQSCAQPILSSDEVPLIIPVDPIAQLISDPITLPSFDFTPIVAPDVNDDFFSSFNNPILPTLW